MTAGPADNRLVLAARIVARDVLRTTPAGIQILDLELQHASEQVEAGGVRQVEALVAAKAAGALARQLAALPLDTTCRFAGFLARKSRNNRQLVFHITAVE